MKITRHLSLEPVTHHGCTESGERSPRRTRGATRLAGHRAHRIHPGDSAPPRGFSRGAKNGGRGARAPRNQKSNPGTKRRAIFVAPSRAAPADDAKKMRSQTEASRSALVLLLFHRSLRRFRPRPLLQPLPGHPDAGQTFRITTAKEFNQPFAHLAAEVEILSRV